MEPGSIFGMHVCVQWACVSACVFNSRGLWSLPSLTYSALPRSWVRSSRVHWWPRVWYGRATHLWSNQRTGISSVSTCLWLSQMGSSCSAFISAFVHPLHRANTSCILPLAKQNIQLLCGSGIASVITHIHTTSIVKHISSIVMKVIRHAELIKFDPSLDDQAHHENIWQFNATFRPSQASVCMPDKVRDGRNVALYCQVFFMACSLDRPKKDQVFLTSLPSYPSFQHTFSIIHMQNALSILKTK